MIAFCKNKLKITYRNKRKKNKQKIIYNYTKKQKSIDSLLHQPINSVPTNSPNNNNIHKHSNQRDFCNFSPSHLP